MGDILNKTVDRAVKLKFIPPADRDAVIQKIEQISSKYGVSGDDFALFSMMENEGLDPHIKNGTGCVGIIQWCPDKSGSGVKTIGGKKVNLEQLRQKEVLQQLPFVDQYFQDAALEQGSQLADLYLTVLNPASRSIKGLDDDLRIPSIHLQADSLKTSAGIITRRSLEAGIRTIGAQKLGGPLPPSDAASSSGGAGSSLPGDYGGQTATGAVGLISGVFTSNCTEPFPITFNLGEALTYTGCKIKLAASQIAGSGFGLGAPANSSLGANATAASVGGAPYSGALAPGGYINPCPKAVFTSPYGQRWGRLHAGLDLAAPIGTPIYAAADGDVILSKMTGVQGFGAAIVVSHGSSNQTVYGHCNAIHAQQGQKVKQGDHIADVGNEGASKGAHVHFEIHVNSSTPFSGNAIDPAPLTKGLPGLRR